MPVVGGFVVDEFDVARVDEDVDWFVLFKFVPEFA